MTSTAALALAGLLGFLGGFVTGIVVTIAAQVRAAQRGELELRERLDP